MSALRYRASLPECVGLGVLFGVVGGLATFSYVQAGVYVTALPVPRWVPMGLIAAAGVLLSLLRLRLRDAIEVVGVTLPLSYVVYMTAFLWPQRPPGGR
ncbi:hypothetical protein ACFQRB_20580 [Halobaculum litoreum]|uniref:Uncharacterized protein n=1 Tax=Halobaculum litoreum TaxID=3031998 RepID=A0ABD5XYN2_9EURY